MALDQLKKLIELTMTFGQLNAKVCNENVIGVNGSYGLDERNNQGDNVKARAD